MTGDITVNLLTIRKLQDVACMVARSAQRTIGHLLRAYSTAQNCGGPRPEGPGSSQRPEDRGQRPSGLWILGEREGQRAPCPPGRVPGRAL